MQAQRDAEPLHGPALEEHLHAQSTMTLPRVRITVCAVHGAGHFMVPHLLCSMHWRSGVVTPRDTSPRRSGRSELSSIKHVGSVLSSKTYGACSVRGVASNIVLKVLIQAIVKLHDIQSFRYRGLTEPNVS